MKIAFCILLFIVSLNAKFIEVGKELKNFSLPDQFDKVDQISINTKYLIITAQRDTSKKVNEFLNTKNVDFLEKNSIQYIANISSMPLIITKLFALPKMRDYNYTILLIYNEKNNIFETKENMITIYSIEKMKITSIKFVSSSEELEKIFR